MICKNIDLTKNDMCKVFLRLKCNKVAGLKDILFDLMRTFYRHMKIKSYIFIL